MSKIALTPNASGTGTFTIAAPNSNTNRTLTLPDVSGEVFSQGNILGTVTESSGVPTGAIIENGSNANGEFVKYADGTMICTLVSPTLTAGTAAGDIFTSAANTRTLPATFSAAPKVAFSASRVGGVIGHWAGSGSATTTTVDVRLLTAVSGATGTVNVIAVGSWF